MLREPGPSQVAQSLPSKPDRSRLDHLSFIKSLDPEFRAQLVARRNGPGIAHLVAHLGLIATSSLLISFEAPLWWCLLPVQGVLIVFLFCLAHEATHRTPFAKATLNDFAGRLAGLPILLPFDWFRQFHLAHHRWTNDPLQDPELTSAPKPDRWSSLLWHISGIPYWGGAVTQLLRNAFGGDIGTYVPARAVQRVRTEARIMLMIYLALLGSLFFSSTLLWLWIIPVLLGQPALRLFLLAEHGRCPAVANMFENTRTTYASRMIRFLSWNMSYHAEHHALPQVPFFRLPELSKKTAPHLAVTAEGYVNATRDAVELRS